MAENKKKRLTPVNPEPPTRRMKFSIWYLVVAALVLLALQSFMGKEQSMTVPYSVFKQWLAEDKVSQASVQQEKIIGKAFHLVAMERPANNPLME